MAKRIHCEPVPIVRAVRIYSGPTLWLVGDHAWGIAPSMIRHIAFPPSVEESMGAWGFLFSSFEWLQRQPYTSEKGTIGGGSAMHILASWDFT